MKIEYQRKLLLFGNQSRWTAGESGWLNNRLAGDPSTVNNNPLLRPWVHLSPTDPLQPRTWLRWVAGRVKPVAPRSQSISVEFLTQIYSWVQKDKEDIWERTKSEGERREGEAEHHRQRPVAPPSPTRFHLSSYDRDGDELKGAGPRVKKVFHQQLRQEVFVDTTFLFNSLTIPLQSKFFFHVALISCQEAITHQGTQNRTPEIQTSLTKSFSNGCILDLTRK